MSELETEKNTGLQELIGEIEDVVTFLEDAHQQHQAAHEVEGGIFRRVLEIGRHALELFFRLCGTGDQGKWISLSKGKKVRRLNDLHKREYCSILGIFERYRAVYGSGEKKKIQCVPLDAQLSLPESKFSYLLQDWSQSIAVDGPFEKVNDVLKRILGLNQSVNSLERMNRKRSETVTDFWDNETPPPLEEEGALLVCQTDCKGVVMRPESKKDPEEEQAIQTPSFNKQGEGTKEGKKGLKKMALLGTAYTVDRYIRTPEEFLDALFRDSTKEEDIPARPRPLFKPLRASLLRDEQETMQPSYDEIFSWLAQEVKLRNPDGTKPVPFVMDGQESLWTALKKYFPDQELIEILDIIHVTSYVWDAAHLFYKKGSTEALRFSKERILRILEGEIEGVVRGMRWKGTYDHLSDEKCEELERICGYLEKNSHRMAYDENLAAGYPIASGVIEGACRNVVVDRMEHSGMRWVMEGAHAMLGMRCIQLSDSWDEFTRFRIQKECDRLYPDYAANDRCWRNIA